MTVYHSNYGIGNSSQSITQQGRDGYHLVEITPRTCLPMVVVASVSVVVPTSGHIMSINSNTFRAKSREISFISWAQIVVIVSLKRKKLFLKD